MRKKVVLFLVANECENVHERKMAGVCFYLFQVAFSSHCAQRSIF